MPCFTIYKTSTGEILRSGCTAGDPAAQLKSGESLLSGVQYLDTTHKVNTSTGAPVALTTTEQEQRSKGFNAPEPI